MTDPTKDQIFLSYARADDDPDYHDPEKSFMRRLYDALKDEYAVWWDRESMPARGLTFLTEIRDAVAQSKRLVLVVGAGIHKSPYVRAEWEFALSQCIPVIPIVRNGGYSTIPDVLQKINAPDFSKDDNFATEIIRLKTILSQEDSPLGELYGVPALPDDYIEREILGSVRETLLVDSNAPVVVTSAKEQSVTVHGVGGIGKTTLSIALGRSCEVRRSFPDGVFFLEMGKTPDVLQRMASLGALLGDAREAYTDETTAKQRLSAQLAGKQALLILDDIWDQRHARAFQVVDPRCRLLITTRQGGIVTQLNAQGERLQTLSEAEGLRLIAGRVGAEVADLPAECAEIIKRVDGHTLAVSLAAAQLDERGLDYAPSLLARMQKGRTFDDKTLSLAEGDKNLNLELCLRLSYDDLSADLQGRFRALGVLTIEGTFDAKLAQALWDDEDNFDTDDALRDLTRAGLIRRDDESTDERYAQHGLLRAYAGALLDAAEERETAFRRYAAYVTTLAEAFYKLPQQDWKQLDDDLPHILHIGDTFVALYKEQENSHELALQFAWNTTWYVIERPEAHRLRWLEMGLDLSRQLENQGRESLFLNQLGVYHNDRGNRTQALSYYEHALLIDREVGDRSGEATTLNNIGMVYNAQGDTKQALLYYQQALPMLRKVGNRSMEGTTLNNIAGIYYRQGDYKQALFYYEQALTIHRDVGNRSTEATTLNNIGLVYFSQNDSEKALAYYEQALPIRREVGDRSGEATTCFNIGSVYYQQGNLDEAIRYVERCVELEELIRHPSLESDRQFLERLKRERAAQNDDPQAAE